MQADGSYSYKAFANTSGTDVFTYTIKDGDGDTSPSTLTINVTNGQPQPVAATGQGGRVRPCNDRQPCRRSGASDHGDGQPDARRSEQPCRDRRVRHGRLGHRRRLDPHPGHLRLPDDRQRGSLHLHADHAGGNVPAGDNGTNIQSGTDAFTYTVQDAFGNTNTSTITISIKDDVPTAKADTDAAQSGETVTGNVETGTSTHGTGAADTAGADGIASIAWTGSVTNGGITTVTGTYGVLTVQADGSYSYKAFANTSGTDVFTYTIKDGDGDTSPSTLTINVTNGQPQPVAATGQVDESGLATIGSHAGDPAHPITATGNLTLGDPNSPVVTGASGTGGSGTADGSTHIQGTYGYLTIDSA
ncbi:Ig-like domain-containing protein [Mesorhizobium atlanticum]